MPTDLEKDIIQSRAINTLKKIPLFHGLYGDEYKSVLTLCRLSSFHKNDVVFERGDSSYTMYVVLSGEVTVKSNSEFVLAPGEILGEIGLVCHVTRTATAVVTEDAVLLEMTKHDFDLMQGKFPRVSAVIMRNIATTLAQRLLKATGQRNDMLL